MRQAARRDRNETEIVRALEKVGALVYRLSAPGMPDLLVGLRERWVLLEVKYRTGALGALQTLFAQRCAASHLPCYLVRTVEEALQAVTWGVTPPPVVRRPRTPARPGTAGRT